MKVLVAYASRTGFTKGIAEFIREKLKDAGIVAEAQEVESVGDLSEYEAFVIGSAAYMSHWLKEAKNFVNRNRKVLAAHPVWLFSSGPVGTSRFDSKGRDVLEASVPDEIEEFRSLIRPRDHRVFFGGLDGSKLNGATGFMYRMAMKSQTVRDSMPEGDFRDWKDIAEWTQRIASSLQTVAV